MIYFFSYRKYEKKKFPKIPFFNEHKNEIIFLRIFYSFHRLEFMEFLFKSEFCPSVSGIPAVLFAYFEFFFKYVFHDYIRRTFRFP